MPGYKGAAIEKYRIYSSAQENLPQEYVKTCIEGNI